MGAVHATKAIYFGGRDKLRGFLANDDPLAAIANSGAFLVWSNQPFYPLYVWFLVGNAAWPSLLTWLSTPFFFAVAPVGRTHPLASRAQFVIAGVGNTLLSVKAFGTSTSVEYFLVPCAIIAATFFRLREWKIASALGLVTGCAAVAVFHLGPPLQVYDDKQSRALAHLNLWSAGVLSAYLIYAAVRARRPDRGAGST